MTIEETCRLSYYEKITTLNEKHGVWLVKNKENNDICVLKELVIYNMSVYEQLKIQQSGYFPRLYDYFQTDDDHLIVIEEYISGKTIADCLERGECFTEEYALWVVSQLCVGMRQLHGLQNPIIHRDLKPSNVIITNDGHVKIIDFNAAKRYEGMKQQDTMLIGTTGFAAPEQYGFGQSDVRTDIYSMGVLLNHMLTGKIPKEQLAQGKCREIIEKCIKIDPDDRFQSVNELYMEISKLIVPDENECEKEEKIKTQKKSNRRFLPPGFRSSEPWKALTAVIGYIFIVYLSTSLTVTKQDGSDAAESEIIFMRIIFFAMSIFFVGFICNYLEMRKHFLFMKHENIVVRIIAGVVWCGAVMLAILIIGILLYQILAVTLL